MKRGQKRGFFEKIVVCYYIQAVHCTSKEHSKLHLDDQSPTWPHSDDPAQWIHQMTHQQTVAVASLPGVGGGLGGGVCGAEGFDVGGVVR